MLSPIRPPYRGSPFSIDDTSTNTGAAATSLDNGARFGPYRSAAIKVGLAKLFEPLNPETTVADLICVHGRNGSSHSTCLHEESDVHWPNNFLHRDIDNARIFTIDYDATVFRFVHSVSRHHIQDHAENLLHHLTIERESTRTVRPKSLD